MNNRGHNAASKPGEVGFQPISRTAPTVDTLDDTEAFGQRMDRMHDVADSYISSLSDEDRAEFLRDNGVPNVPHDTDELDEMARDLAHEIASEHVNGDGTEEELTAALSARAQPPNHQTRDEPEMTGEQARRADEIVERPRF